MLFKKHFSGKNVVALARHLSKDQLQPVFHQACRDLYHSTVTELLRIGGDPFWTDSKGFTCIIMAALSSVDARYKLRLFQSFKASIMNYFCQTNKGTEYVYANQNAYKNYHHYQ